VSRSFEDALRWIEEGTELFREVAADLSDTDLRAASSLPGWTNGHLVAHVAANAKALSNLATWAATGVDTPMYATPHEREAGIALGESITADQVNGLLASSAHELAEAMAALTTEQWMATVRTAQGRLLPATEIAWLRAREVLVHAVDVQPGIAFDGLDPTFLTALAEGKDEEALVEKTQAHLQEKHGRSYSRDEILFMAL